MGRPAISGTGGKFESHWSIVVNGKSKESSTSESHARQERGVNVNFCSWIPNETNNDRPFARVEGRYLSAREKLWLIESDWMEKWVISHGAVIIDLQVLRSDWWTTRPTAGPLVQKVDHSSKKWTTRPTDGPLVQRMDHSSNGSNRWNTRPPIRFNHHLMFTRVSCMTRQDSRFHSKPKAVENSSSQKIGIINSFKVIVNIFLLVMQLF